MPKPKKCKVCTGEFTPSRPMQNVCSPICDYALKSARKKKAAKKEWGKDKKRRLDKLKTKSDYAKDLQAICNRYIRERDKGQACISCGRHTGAKMNAGHYLSVGAHPELRYHPMNIHLQCEHCNTHLSGNQIRYRQSLIEKIGLTNVEWLEGPHKAQKWTIEDYKDGIVYFRELIKNIEK